MVKVDWYQSDQEFFLVIYAPKIIQKTVFIIIEEKNLFVRFSIEKKDKREKDQVQNETKAETEENKDESIEIKKAFTLSHPIRGPPVLDLTETKLQIKARKLNPNITWTTLEEEGGDESKMNENNDNPNQAISNSPSANSTEKTLSNNNQSNNIKKQKDLKYPTSSKHPIDWDSIARDHLDTKDSFNNSKSESVEDFFKKIYENSSDDKRRAMNKSFQESSGTVLSTNWDEIGSKKTLPSPPEGMESKTFKK